MINKIMNLSKALEQTLCRVSSLLKRPESSHNCSIINRENINKIPRVFNQSKYAA